MTRVFEQDNRRAEVNGQMVSYFRATGDQRRSKVGIWWQTYESEQLAVRMAKRWAFLGKMGKLVLR